MLNILKNLCAPIAVSGNEGPVREIIEREIAPYCSKIYTDRGGNLIAEKKGKKPSKNKVLLAAHMDEVGIIITAITDSGFLKFSCVGGIDSRLFLGKTITICTENGNIRGVVGLVPIHLLSADERKQNCDIDTLYIDIGAQSKAEAQNMVSLGDTGVLDSEFSEFGDNKVLARALDDRCGCAVLIKLLKSDLEYDITAVFTVQEEIGLRGAQMAAEELNPDIAIVIDSTTACDIQNIPEENTVCSLSNGPVVSFMDKGCVYNRKLFSLIMKEATQNNIKAQVKRAVAGANDSGAINKARGGVKTAAISLPCRYLHSAGCVIDKNDLTETLRLVKAVLKKACEL